MQPQLKSMKFNIGQLRRSQKMKILEALKTQKEQQVDFRRATGFASAPAATEVNELVLRLLSFYRTEKNFEGTDRLFSAGREVAEIFKEAEMFDVFEKSLTSAFRRDFRQKLRKDPDHQLYLGKARALMQGIGQQTEAKFDQMLSDLKIQDNSCRQPSLLDDQPTLN